jgi:hypothetical protein
MPGTAAVYFVASPLQYLAARRIAQRFEPGSRQILIWYKRAVGPVVKPDEWDQCAYLPWPRFEPLPGLFGAHRRLLQNLRQVAALVGECDSLHLHSAVFDTEAINYFLRGLPRACHVQGMHARILPDGLISIRRYPLTPLKRALQQVRRLRRLASPELDYWTFAGDRIGSDAPFCDRIYVLPGLPHEYPAHKVVVLPPLVEGASVPAGSGRERRALVIGQPLVGFNLMTRADCARVGKDIQAWLTQQNVDIQAWLTQQNVARIDYKGHPKDANRDLMQPGYHVLDLSEPLESYLSKEPYDVVAGVRSSALLFARQIYGPQTPVVAFGWDRVQFKSQAEREDMRRAFLQCGVVLQ